MLRMLEIASRRSASSGEIEIVKPLMASNNLMGIASIFAAFKAELMRLCNEESVLLSSRNA